MSNDEARLQIMQKRNQKQSFGQVLTIPAALTITIICFQSKDELLRRHDHPWLRGRGPQGHGEDGTHGTPTSFTILKKLMNCKKSLVVLLFVYSFAVALQLVQWPATTSQLSN